jgi:hypothetical protein
MGETKMFHVATLTVRTRQISAVNQISALGLKRSDCLEKDHELEGAALE